MKQIFLAIIAVFTLNIAAQEPTFKKFYNAHKDLSEFSINLSASLAGSFLKAEDQKELKALVDKTSDFKLMVFNNESNSLQKDFKRYISKNKLKTLARVKGDDARAEFYFLEKEGYVREIILKASSNDDSLVPFGLQLKVTMEELSEMLSSSNLNTTSK